MSGYSIGTETPRFAARRGLDAFQSGLVKKDEQSLLFCNAQTFCLWYFTENLLHLFLEQRLTVRPAQVRIALDCLTVSNCCREKYRDIHTNFRLNTVRLRWCCRWHSEFCDVCRKIDKKGVSR